MVKLTTEALPSMRHLAHLSNECPETVRRSSVNFSFDVTVDKLDDEEDAGECEPILTLELIGEDEELAFRSLA